MPLKQRKQILQIEQKGFLIRIKIGDRNVEVGGKGVTRAAGVAF